MPDFEQTLPGGNVSSVVRIGGCVHRPMEFWSPSVHELLRYLESSGFNGAPRFLGMDSQGREMLTYVEGQVGNDPIEPYMASDEVLVGMAHLLRRYHDASAGFIAQGRPGRWQMVYPDKSRHEVICHNDVAHYNTVFREGMPVALIDFDTAGPGPRIWDIAYALYRFVPLSRFSFGRNGDLLPYDARHHREERRERIRLFCEAYGFERRDQLWGAVDERLSSLCAFITEKAASGIAAYRTMIDEGHLDHYREEIRFHRECGREVF